MFRSAARLRAIAGALCCALIIGLTFTSTARSEPFDMLEVVRASPRASGVVSHGASGLAVVALRDLGRGKFTPHPGAWCADAVNAWLRRAGLSPGPSRRAVDFARYGRPDAARPGVLAVSRHHVGIVLRVSPRGVVLVSGNWRGRVRVHAARGVIAFRAPV